MCFLGLEYLQDGSVSDRNRIDFTRLMYVLQDRVNHRLDDVNTYYLELVERKNSSNRADDVMQQIFHNITRKQYTYANTDMTIAFYNICSSNQTDRMALHKTLIDAMREEGVNPSWTYQLIMLIFFTLILVIQLPCIIFLTHNANMSTQCIYTIVSVFLSRTKELKNEQRKSEMLLQEMLPKFIANQLKIGRHVHALHYESVTIYFSEVSDFSEIIGSE